MQASEIFPSKVHQRRVFSAFFRDPNQFWFLAGIAGLSVNVRGVGGGNLFSLAASQNRGQKIARHCNAIRAVKQMGLFDID